MTNFLMNVEIIRFLEYKLWINFNMQGDLRTQKDAISVLGRELINNAEIIKFGIKYFLTVVLRSSSWRSKLIAPLYNFIETAIENNIIIALYVAELFTYDHIISEFLMTVPLITFETVIAGLLSTAIKKIYENEEPYIKNYISDFIKQKEKSEKWIMDRLQDKDWIIGNIKWSNEAQQDSDFDEGEEEEEEEESESEEGNEEIAEKEDLINFDNKEVSKAPTQSKSNRQPNIYTFLYSKKHDYEGVPIIIRIANIIILKTYDADSRHSRSHNLLNILYKIAQLSSEMRLYFLENKMVGRLLDQFYGDLWKFKSIFSNKSAISLFKTNIPCSIPVFENDHTIQEFDNSINANENKEASVYTDIYHKSLCSNLQKWQKTP